MKTLFISHPEYQFTHSLIWFAPDREYTLRIDSWNEAEVIRLANAIK
jgi:hypothetical protein